MTRRRAVRLSLLALLCLLLGAVTTVAVAVAASIIEFPNGSPGLFDDPQSRVRWREYRGVGLTRVAVSLRQSGLPASDDFDHPLPIEGSSIPRWARLKATADEGADPSDPPDIYTVAAGWPLRCLTYSYAEFSEEPVWSYRLSSAWLDRTGFYGRTIPLRPITAGFALDTALYASAWYLLLFTPLPLYRAGRRRFRVSRGMCGSCGYDLGGLAGGVCPECGKPAPAAIPG